MQPDGTSLRHCTDGSIVKLDLASGTQLSVIRHADKTQKLSGKALLQKALGNGSEAAESTKTNQGIEGGQAITQVYFDERTGSPYTVDPKSGGTSWLKVNRDKSFKRTKTSTYYVDEEARSSYKVRNDTGKSEWVRDKSLGRSNTGSDIYHDDASGFKYKHNSVTGETTWLDQDAVLL